ncbi:MAG: alcohol dehydrogenase catalytic domain-containing protein [Spirochaetaceae bacterium]|nr:alcohol dehydrogenase catalytic domain-containing protein [Spirochaetaceae bacterium]
MKNTVYYLDKPNGTFTAIEELIGNPGPGEIRLKTLRTSVCQSDVVIYKQGLPRIRQWPAIILHEASCRVDAVGSCVTKFQVGDLVGLGCDIPCGDRSCIYCGDKGTGDWTSCPNTQATGHEFPGFAREYAILPDWFVDLGPVVKFDSGVTPDEACHLEPLACNLEGMTRVNNCIDGRIVVLIGAGSQSTYALQSSLVMGARKVIIINRGAERLQRVLKDFGDERVVGLPWTDDVREKILAQCKPFNEPHFIMVNASAEAAYRLAVDLMGYGTVLDAHAGVKGSDGKSKIFHEVDLNNDVHYKLQCYQATHGSVMHGINLAHEMINSKKLPRLGRMTVADEVFAPCGMLEAIRRASDSDSLKVIIDWEQE